MAPAIDANHPVALVNKEQHLSIPVVGTERPTMVEDDRLAASPVFVEDLCAVVGGDRAHGLDSVAAVGKERIVRGFAQPGRLAGRLVAKAPTAAELARNPRRLSDDESRGTTFAPSRATYSHRYSQPMPWGCCRCSIPTNAIRRSGAMPFQKTGVVQIFRL